MMREILFRGKRMSNGEWVEGFLCKAYTHDAPHTHDGIMFKTEQKNWIAQHYEYMTAIIDPATVGQYTGLQDKNGKRIFEGDIVLDAGAVCKIMFEDGQWKEIYPGDYWADLYCSEVEVIGNIHDNPELMGGALC